MLIANMVLLAHAVVPHHHHHEQVCIDNTCCKEDADHKHNTPEQNHQHDGDKNTATCVLKQAIALPANQGRQEFDSVNSPDNHSHDFLFTLYNDGAETEIPAFPSLVSTPEITFSYSTYLISSLGLRAPPTI
jgi:hypothetical protein